MLIKNAQSRKVKRLTLVLSLAGPSRWDVSHSDKIRPRSPNRRFASTPAGVNKTKTRHKDRFLFYGAESRNRTGTGAKSQQILSLLRLPVPPYPRHY